MRTTFQFSRGGQLRGTRPGAAKNWNVVRFI